MQTINSLRRIRFELGALKLGQMASLLNVSLPTYNRAELGNGFSVAFLLKVQGLLAITLDEARQLCDGTLPDATVIEIAKRYQQRKEKRGTEQCA